jgi:superfamily I DNA/RNA helicase
VENLKIAIGDAFLESFALIPKNKQKKVMEFVAKFRYNPKSSGINYERINDARDPNFRSVRIDQDYRGIVLKPEKGDVYVLLWVARHDEAYDWARRHRCNIHPRTGVLQLLEIQQANDTDLRHSRETPTTQSQPPLFDLSDETFLSLGVPEESLEWVRNLCSVEELEAREKSLPIEAFEALYLLAAGTPLNELLQEYAVPETTAPIDTDDFAGALEHEASRRRFYVVENEMELLEMLEAPLEKWRVFLHPSQRRLVERHWNGPVRVLGGAGTGKTVVAMHRAKWLAQHTLGPGDRLLFTTFTSNLAIDIQENLRKICSPEILERIEVQHIDAWVSKFLKKEGYPYRIVYPGGKDSEYGACWALAEALVPADLGLPLTFYHEEWERVILPQSIHTRQDYLKANRFGRGVALTRKQRAEIWSVFEEMRIQLAQRKLTTIEDAIHDLMAKLDAEPRRHVYRSVVVDEGQDFGPSVLTLLRRLVPEQPDDLFIVGDGHQRIYQRRAVLSKCGINVRGRARKLRINYRTTEEIRRFATAVLEGVEIDDMDDGVDSTRDYRSLMHGELPDVCHFSSIENEAHWIAERIEVFLTEGLLSQDICVVARTTSLLDEFGALLHRMGLETRKLSRHVPDNRSLPGVRLATMHRVKGLEFKAVFMAGINHGVVPLSLRDQETQDPVEARLYDVNERALFHVSATRAIRHLAITSHGMELCSKVVDERLR